MRIGFGITSLAVMALSTWALSTRADDEKISPEHLPAAVKKAIKKKFHKAEIQRASKEVEDGTTTYEVSLEVEDRPVDVTLSADGSILEIEKVIPFEQVPARVKQALAKKYPAAKITKVEAVTRGEDGPAVYEIAISTEIVLDAKGNFVDATDEDETPSAKAKKPKKHDAEDDDDERGEKATKGRDR